jgi:hypothetical protein
VKPTAIATDATTDTSVVSTLSMTSTPPLSQKGYAPMVHVDQQTNYQDAHNARGCHGREMIAPMMLRRCCASHFEGTPNVHVVV